MLSCKIVITLPSTTVLSLHETWYTFITTTLHSTKLTDCRIEFVGLIDWIDWLTHRLDGRMDGWMEEWMDTDKQTYRVHKSAKLATDLWRSSLCLVLTLWTSEYDKKISLLSTWISLQQTYIHMQVLVCNISYISLHDSLLWTMDIILITFIYMRNNYYCQLNFPQKLFHTTWVSASTTSTVFTNSIFLSYETELTAKHNGNAQRS
jgi:hypothetical protein